jgi:tetratricopeptide (TPR) repeat protein
MAAPGRLCSRAIPRRQPCGPSREEPRARFSGDKLVVNTGFPRLAHLLSAAVVLLSLATTVAVAAETDPDRRWALVIGVSRYSNAEPLLYAASDAEAFAEFLKSPRGGRFQSDRVVTLLEDQATRFGVFAEFELMQDRVEPGDTVYIFLAGHGYVNRRGIGYFVPSDGDLNLLAPTSVPFTFLKELIELGLAHATHRVLVTDLCHAGRIGPEKSELAARIQNLINQELLNLEAGRGNFLNLLASRPSEPSWERDDLKSGVFSHVLLKALNGEAADPGTPLVTARRVVDYVLAEVPKYTSNQQNPMANREFDPELPLANLELPGPGELDATDGPRTSLVIRNSALRGFARVEWADPLSGATVMRRIPDDVEEIPVEGMAPGAYRIRLFLKSGEERELDVDVRPGINIIDLDRMAAASGFGVSSAQLASRIPGSAAFLQGSSPAAFPGTASVLLHLAAGTEIYVDGDFLGRSETEGYVQLGGLTPGVHRVFLVPSPDREYRFRLELFDGAHSLDWRTGQLRALARIPEQPSRVPLPEGLPGDLEQAYRGLEEALWTDRLLEPPGESAWDRLQQLRGLVSPMVETELERRLAIAMGNRAQRLILRYLRGGDIRWTPEVFEEGAGLLSRVRGTFASNVTVLSQQHFFRGRALAERGEFDEAGAELRKAIELDPEASHAFNALGLALWRQNRLEEAEVQLLRAIELSPTWTYPRNTLALIRVERRRYEEAEAMFRESIPLDPRDSTAYHGLGQLYALMGRWEEAEGLLLQSIDAHPGNAYAHHTLARLHQRLLNLEEAEEWMRLAIRLEPDEPAFRISLAELLGAMGRVDEADEVLERALQSDSDNLDLLRARAFHLAASDRAAEGEAVLRRALDLAPGDAHLRVAAGLFWRGRDRGRAIEAFREALDRDADNPYAHHNLGLMAVEDGDHRTAERALERSIAADPRYAPPRLLLGRVRAARGDFRHALDLLRSARELSVEPAQRQEVEERILEVAEAYLEGRIAEADARAERGRRGDAWRIIRAVLKEFPDHPRARDAALRYAAEFTDLVQREPPPPGMLADVLASLFWSTERRAEQLWGRGARLEALELVRGATASIEPGSIFLTTRYNLGNEEFSIHRTLYRWAERMLEISDFDGARGLLELAMEKGILGVVPGLEPTTVDSLMVSADSPRPSSFSDYEVAFHPDRRAHELLVLSAAGMGDIDGVRTFLAAIEEAGPDRELRDRAARYLSMAGRPGEAAELMVDEE